ncbi:heme ABC transporter ATP-binding protein [Ectothiorhodospira lacustris]|uniref:heme ABC transporter ATP-binding protein n=1 Tax=Ectothiorhodospira lacustris TaxID=2899127 RepID=UPI001EE90FE7|nr:heme ABC transporter ATP-binding protein [Ectothiorhodospira lacustris]MCG5511340.1 heme ABC transporter ATP-binding protein [Ectothiorhodospira lacustris]MCG5523126.1 heme ABC transporter ATP-binding protein [Ectothiorhodospira lacustris]
MNTQALARISNLVVERGGRRLLDQAGLEAHPGSVHVLVGPNGAGKSTLLSVMAGDMPPSSGEVTWCGQALDQWCPHALARCRAVLPQENVVTFPLTAWEVAEMGRLPHRTPDRDARIVREALDRAGVWHLSGRDYRSLSGGERQRVQMARVLAQVHDTGPDQPGLLLLDEPTSALDVRHQLRLMELLRVDAARGRTILVVLHDLNLAAAYADHITVLKDGKVVASGTPAQVMRAETITHAWGVECLVEKDSLTGCPWVRMRYGLGCATAHREHAA